MDWRSTFLFLCSMLATCRWRVLHWFELMLWLWSLSVAHQQNWCSGLTRRHPSQLRVHSADDSTCSRRWSCMRDVFFTVDVEAGSSRDWQLPVRKTASDRRSTQVLWWWSRFVTLVSLGFENQIESCCVRLRFVEVNQDFDWEWPADLCVLAECLRELWMAVVSCGQRTGFNDLQEGHKHGSNDENKWFRTKRVFWCCAHVFVRVSGEWGRFLRFLQITPNSIEPPSFFQVEHTA